MSGYDPRDRLPFDLPEVDYERYSNRQLVTPPLVLLAASFLVIGAFWGLTGAPVDQGIEFTGGTELRVAVDGPPGEAREEIRSAFDVAPANIQTVETADGVYIVTFDQDSVEEAGSPLAQQARDAGFDVRAQTSISPSFGGDAQRQALAGIAVAFLGMSVLVFAMFRTFVPSIAVVISAFSDIVVPLALMDLLGIELTLGTVAALLMIIGYSVDSDILLNNHILRRSGGFYESTYRAMRTGVTMTLTSLSAMAVMAFVATLFGVQLLAAIGVILVFGLATDLVNTYMMNLSLLRWYKYEGVAR